MKEEEKGLQVEKVEYVVSMLYWTRRHGRVLGGKGSRRNADAIVWPGVGGMADAVGRFAAGIGSAMAVSGAQMARRTPHGPWHRDNTDGVGPLAALALFCVARAPDASEFLAAATIAGAPVGRVAFRRRRGLSRHIFIYCVL